MQLLYFFITLFLMIVPSYGMEEEKDQDVMQLARIAVRPVIHTTLEQYVIDRPTKALDWTFFKLNFYSKDFTNRLTNDITQFLKDGSTPSYLGCEDSFKEVGEALKMARIFPDKHTGIIKLLTPKEAEVRRLEEEFILLN